MRSVLLILALDGNVALDPKPYPGVSFRSAANPVLLPKAKPRAVREHFVVSSIRSREVARTQRSSIRHREDALKALDFGNSLLRVHSSQYLTERRGCQFEAASPKTATVRFC
jgi:hypothetical protein